MASNNICPPVIVLVSTEDESDCDDSDLEEYSYEVESDSDLDQIYDSSSDSSDNDTSITASDAKCWKKLSAERMARPPFPFTGTAGANFIGDNEGGLLQYFEKLMDEDVNTMMVEETNRYAVQSGATSWKSVSNDEVKVFLEQFFYKGLFKSQIYKCTGLMTK